jgi:hypothetical protein
MIPSQFASQQQAALLEITFQLNFLCRLCNFFGEIATTVRMRTSDENAAFFWNMQPL